MSIKIDQVPEMIISKFKNISIGKDKPVNLLVDEGRGTGKSDIVMFQSDLAFISRSPFTYMIK